ncbi:hypothetical protein HF521_010011 [Silurus meridionalis]|uniref:RING-type domain-containing protein n=1 Tax=Silurus meridionalis TaxID=175797 RepID=A0A8T0AL00_SILME|nr:hypothetical protein HF521_010011 [Silurus meridionalis]
MAHARVVEQKYNCTICKELKDPVTLPCGHNYCKACINGYWDQGVFVCSQCRQSFTPRLVLGTNTVLVYAMDKIKQTAIHEAGHKEISGMFAEMNAMMPHLRIILQQSIESQSQAPNAASTSQAAPAPEPSVVVEDDDEDNDEDDENA